MLKVNVIIPVRDRDRDLAKTIPKLREKLTSQGIDYRLWVFEQESQSDPFNKGKLINAAFLEAIQSAFSDNYLINDADIFVNTLDTLPYRFSKNAIHYYGFRHCLGGFFSISQIAFLKANGFSNDYWGWGWEDADFQSRVISSGTEIDRSTFYERNSTDLVYDRFDRDGHKKSNKPHKYQYQEKIQQYQKGWRGIKKEGLSSTEYKVTAKKAIPACQDISKYIVSIPKDSVVDSPAKVTIICSVYNAEKWLPNYFKYVDAQSLEQFEIVFINASSTDHSRQLLENATFRSGITKHVINTAERTGVYQAWNIGISKASTDYVMNVNTDDKIHADHLERYLQAAAENPNADLIYGPCLVVSDTLHTKRIRVYNWPEYSYATLLRYCIFGPFPMVKRDTIISLGMFDESFVSSGDYEFWLRMANAGCHFCRVPEITGSYYANPEGISTSAHSKPLRQNENRRIRAFYSPLSPDQ